MIALINSYVLMHLMVIEKSLCYFKHSAEVKNNCVNIELDGKAVWIKCLVKIEDNFDPTKYSLIHDKEKHAYPVIVYASHNAKQKYITERRNWVYNTYRRGNPLTDGNIIVPNIGDKIHLKAKGGTYTVVAVEPGYVEVTTIGWSYEQDPNNRTKFFELNQVQGFYNKH